MAQGGNPGGMPISGNPGTGQIPNMMQRPGMGGGIQQPTMGHGAMQFGQAQPGGGGYNTRQPPVYGGPPPVGDLSRFLPMMNQSNAAGVQQLLSAFGQQMPQQGPQQGGTDPMVPQMNPSQGSMGFQAPGSDFLYRSQQRGL